MIVPRIIMATRRIMLARLRKAGVEIWEDNLDRANCDLENDNPLRIETAITSARLDQIFALMDTGSSIWGTSKEQQEQAFGKSLSTATKTLAILLCYKQERGQLPRPDLSWWGLRCCDAYSTDSTLIISSCQEHKLDIWHCTFDEIHHHFGALPDE